MDHYIKRTFSLTVPCVDGNELNVSRYRTKKGYFFVDIANAYF